MLQEEGVDMTKGPRKVPWSGNVGLNPVAESASLQ